jgi:hypothetical protein
MRHPNGRSFAIGRIVAVLILALAIATPASAQFGAIKKKLKGETASKGIEKAAGETSDGKAAPSGPTETGAAAPGGPTGGTLVMTPELVDRLIAGLKAGKAEREKAKTEDTPYGRYLKAQAAYEVAKSKCDAAQQTWATRLMANEKLMAKSQRFMEKMSEAQQREDTAAVRAFGDSATGLVDASCLVKSPERPNDYYEAQRAIDERAEAASVTAADFSSSRDLGYASDRAIAILEGQAPDASASEKSAVSARDPELKSLLGIRSAQEEKVSRQGKAAVADTARPAPAPAPAAPVVPAGAVALNDCMMKNVQAHEAEIQALGDRGSAAQQAGNNALMMAIADTIRQIQYAGCNGAR